MPKKRAKCPHCKGSGKVPEPSPFDSVWMLNAEEGQIASAKLEEREMGKVHSSEPTVLIDIEDQTERRGTHYIAVITEGVMDGLVKEWKRAKQLATQRRKKDGKRNRSKK